MACLRKDEFIGSFAMISFSFIGFWGEAGTLRNVVGSILLALDSGGDVLASDFCRRGMLGFSTLLLSIVAMGTLTSSTSFDSAANVDS
jgi:hypothetical protein